MFLACKTYEKQLRIEKTWLSHQVWSHGGSTFKTDPYMFEGIYFVNSTKLSVPLCLWQCLFKFIYVLPVSSNFIPSHHIKEEIDLNSSRQLINSNPIRKLINVPFIVISIQMKEKGQDCQCPQNPETDIRPS